MEHAADKPGRNLIQYFSLFTVTNDLSIHQRKPFLKNLLATYFESAAIILEASHKPRQYLHPTTKAVVIENGTRSTI